MHIRARKHVVWHIDRQSRYTGDSTARSQEYRTKERNRKKENKVAYTKTFDISRVRRDHPRCRIAIWICLCGHTRDVGFIKIGSGILEPQGVEICNFPLLWLLAFTTACTFVIRYGVWKIFSFRLLWARLQQLILIRALLCQQAHRLCWNITTVDKINNSLHGYSTGSERRHRCCPLAKMVECWIYRPPARLDEHTVHTTWVTVGCVLDSSVYTYLM